jgi:hypothetical protein
MSIKFDGLSRIIDEFVDGVDSLSKFVPARRLTGRSRTRAAGDPAVGHYAVQDDIGKVAVISALPPQEGMQAPVE